MDALQKRRSSAGKKRNPDIDWRARGRSAESRDAKRELILNTAMEMFNERGYTATSLDDVARKLNVTKPTIYYYFADKDQILFECVRVGLHQLHTAARQIHKVPGTGLDRLRALLRGYADIISSGFGGCVARTSEQELSEVSRQEFRRLKRGYDRTIRKVIQEGIADGSVTRVDVRLAAFTFAGALNWITRWYNSAGPMTAAEIGQIMVDILVRGVEPR
jgi:AcrR family transcriptional regulator